VALFWYQAVGNFETNYGCVSNVYKLRAMSLFVPLVLQVSTVLLPHVALFCPCAYNHESPSPALWSAPQVRNLSRHGEAQAREYCRKRKLSPCACACIFAACYTILSVCLQSRKSIRQLCGPRRRYETYRGTAKHVGQQRRSSAATAHTRRVLCLADRIEKNYRVVVPRSRHIFFFFVSDPSSSTFHASLAEPFAVYLVPLFHRLLERWMAVAVTCWGAALRILAIATS
jgi:hypothetical protein